jgi:hypothetical protein
MPLLSSVPDLTAVRQSAMSSFVPNCHCVPASSWRLTLFSARMLARARGLAILWSRIAWPAARAVDVSRDTIFSDGDAFP